MTNPEVKQLMLNVADYERLAERAEERSAPAVCG